MTDHWMDVLAILALQHLWQGAVLALLVWMLAKLYRRLGADVRSWILLCAFLLAVILPLAVLLPGNDAAPPTLSNAVAHTVTLQSPVQHATMMQASTAATWPAMFGPILLGAWLLGFLWSLHRLLAGYLAARGLQDTARYLPDAARVFPHALPHASAIRVSERISSPMVVGFIRPCILFPQRLIDELPVATRLHILRHEIAHIRRRDLWASLIQALCLAVYWWSPWLRLLGAQLDMAREMACDERAAMHSKSSTDYANALLASADKVMAPRHSPRHSPRLLAAGIFNTQAALTRRIEGLLNMDIKQRISGTGPIAAACATVILASVALTLLATPRMGTASPAKPATAGTSHDGDGDGAMLVEAVNANRLDLVRLLVKNGANINASARGDGTALIVAAKQGNLSIVHELIELGANVNQPSPGDGNPLIVAAAFGNLDIAQALINAGANVNAIVPGDETPLINAARRGHLPIVEYLVEHGADVNLGMLADRGEWRSPLNQADNGTIRQYLIDRGALPHK